MEKVILEILQEDVKRRIRERETYLNAIHHLQARDEKFCGKIAPKIIHEPGVWKIDNKFNPYYVKRHIKAIALSVSRKIQKKQFIPNPPFLYRFTKNGKPREATIFQIPDEAVSKYLYRRLLNKNRHRFSSLCYAYRNDRNIHFAIQDIALDIQSNTQIYVAEFDFKEFFNSIQHQYLFKVLQSGFFNITPEEIELIKCYLPNRQDGIEAKGISLGTSISLFLANAVCYHLDRSLESIGLRFARYADDTLIWSESRDKIEAAKEAIIKFSYDSGVAINYEKSDEINQLLPCSKITDEKNQKSYIEFCGYKVDHASISIKDANIRKIKKNISILINKYLLRPAREDAAGMRSWYTYDPAYLSTISQIRRYMYGQLTDAMLINYLRGTSHRVTFNGVMSFYPLVNNENQLKMLDIWLFDALFGSVRKRAALLRQKEFTPDNIFPYSCKRESFLNKSKIERIGDHVELFRIPSFLRIYQAIKKGVEYRGVEEVMNQDSDPYNY